MAANLYAEFDSTPGTVANDVRTRVLSQGDWSDISPGLGTTLATFGAASAVGATTFTISNTATNAAGMSVGDIVVVDKGLATEERFKISARTSNTALAVTDAAMYAHASGAIIQSGHMILKATTTRGAQMVVDLPEGGSTLFRLNPAVYRTHDGTTGVDKLARFITFRSTNSSGSAAATDPVHVVLSVGKEHFYLSIEGPRVGEAGVDYALGSARGFLALCDLVPYFDTDTVPAAVCVGFSTNGQGSEPFCWVSRNQGNTASWVTAKLGTVTYPTYPWTAQGSNYAIPGTFAQQAKADGNTYFFPFVVVEQADGLRGRMASFLDAGYDVASIAGEPVVTAGQRFTVGGVNYITTYHSKYSAASGSQLALSPFGVAFASTSSGQSAILVPA